MDVVIVDAVRSAVGRAHKGSLAETRPDELAGQVIAGAPRAGPPGEAVARRGSRPRLRHARGRAGAQRGARRRPPRRPPRGARRGRPSTASAPAACRPSPSPRAPSPSARPTWSIAGGVESMTMVPMTGNKLSASPEAMRRVASVYTPMGITAENVANKFSIARADQDAFALREPPEGGGGARGGQVRSRDRHRAGHPLPRRRARRPSTSAADELIRAGDDGSRGSPASSRRSRPRGSVTAGNSSPLSRRRGGGAADEPRQGEEPGALARSASSARS